MLVDQVVVVRVGPWKTDHLPGNLVFVAAIDRIGKESFHGVFQEEVKKRVGGNAVEVDASLFETGKVRIFLRRGQSIKGFALFRKVGIDRGNRSTE